MNVLHEILGYFVVGFIGTAITAVLYMPVYFILRKKVPLLRQLTIFLFIACVLVILTATVLGSVYRKFRGGESLIAEYRILNLVPFNTFKEKWAAGEGVKITQLIANALMFVPLGAFFPAVVKNARRLWKTAAYMALFSFLIEFTQYFIGRSADIDDLIFNTLGGVVGYVLFYIFTGILKNNVKQKICEIE